MIIREATNQDTKEIVKLLKLSLGENLIKKTPRIWQYKHIENPFGKSLVLLAEKNDILVGVRAFMQWRWQLGSQTYVTYRAVDTATHPEYQKQGIFKKLSLQALQKASHNTQGFVFNTPNQNSLPGYLKMGWQKAGKIKLNIIPAIPVIYKKTNIITTQEYKYLPELCDIHNQRLELSKKLFTPKSVEYLTWRYLNNPIQTYTVFAQKDFFMAFYVKKHRFFNELRISELIVRNTHTYSKICRMVNQIALNNNCLLISSSENKLCNLKIYGKFGPILTIKPFINNRQLIKALFQSERWSYSLGDLELF